MSIDPNGEKSDLGLCDAWVRAIVSMQDQAQKEYNRVTSRVLAQAQSYTKDRFVDILEKLKATDDPFQIEYLAGELVDLGRDLERDVWFDAQKEI